MLTHATKVDGGYNLNGGKMWISNAPFADLAIIWAKDDSMNKKIRGFIVEKAFKGFETHHIEGKLSLRASNTGAIHLTDCFVPDANVLPDAFGLKAPLKCLSSARLGIACGVVAAAEECLRIARDYTMERQQFGRPLAKTQLIQSKLAAMLCDIAYMQQAALRVTQLKDQGKLAHEAISILKRNNCQTSLNLAREARDMLGGNGISDGYDVMRIMCNLETCNTYESTHDVHSLIIGRAITGLNAF